VKLADGECNMAKSATVTELNPAPVLDMSKMTVAEIEAYLAQKKLEQARLLLEKKADIIKELEAYVLKTHGFSLSDLGLSEKTERAQPATAGIYINPTTKEEYSYRGLGKVPDWLKTGGNGDDANKPNQAYRKVEASV
jgi:hypothetical protein